MSKNLGKSTHDREEQCQINPFPNDKFSLKEFLDDNFEFNENGRKFSKRVENSVGKGEIARNEQFLLFPQFFQKTCAM